MMSTMCKGKSVKLYNDYYYDSDLLNGDEMGMLFMLVVKLCVIHFKAYFYMEWSFADFASKSCLRSFVPGSAHFAEWMASSYCARWYTFYKRSLR